MYRAAAERNCRLDTPLYEYMITQVLTVDPGQTIEHCMALMTDKHIRHLPVIENGALIVLVSVADLVKGIISDQTALIHDLENYITGSGYGC